ncbi:MAG: formylglycine-generating enzyme family protein, partial [bacterium]|nr:formylglycine-generating enzyme family protein [bacterium]
TWSAAEADNGTNLYRHKDAMYYMPTEDEWVKAGYWNGTALQTYPNASPGDLVSGSPDPAKWNYSSSAGSVPWDVGSGVEELNGTYDMMGNVWEWMESPYSDPTYGPRSGRGLRGGSFSTIDVSDLASSYRIYGNPYHETYHFGFRVASEVPEPTTLTLLALGGLLMARQRR